MNLHVKHLNIKKKNHRSPDEKSKYWKTKYKTLWSESLSVFFGKKINKYMSLIAY